MCANANIPKKLITKSIKPFGFLGKAVISFFDINKITPIIIRETSLNSKFIVFAVIVLPFFI